jgi:NAD(P)-dependent dehydrogenase (short-subunit alcohol dehydrogenase family)
MRTEGEVDRFERRGYYGHGMGRTVLITEADTPLGAALVRLFMAKGDRVAAAVGAGAPAGEGRALAEYRAKPFVSVVWNRQSPVSARNLLLATLNAFGSLDEALILAPPAPATALEKCSTADIDRAFDDSRGTVFIARELLAHFKARGGGVLCMVGTSSHAPDQAGPAVEQALREAFHGFASALLASHATGPLILNGFQGHGTGPEEYSAFIERTLEEKARKITGRWFTCQPRGGILGRRA